jgi:hypothetical protein
MELLGFGVTSLMAVFTTGLKMSSPIVSLVLWSLCPEKLEEFLAEGTDPECDFTEKTRVVYSKSRRSGLEEHNYGYLIEQSIVQECT